MKEVVYKNFNSYTKRNSKVTYIWPDRTSFYSIRRNNLHVSITFQHYTTYFSFFLLYVPNIQYCREFRWEDWNVKSKRRYRQYYTMNAPDRQRRVLFLAIRENRNNWNPIRRVKLWIATKPRELLTSTARNSNIVDVTHTNWPTEVKSNDIPAEKKKKKYEGRS